MRNETFERQCQVCGHTYKVVIERLPCRMEDKRDTYYQCPYCKSNESTVKIHLDGNEEAYTYRK